jgi:hypothetical protein
MKKPLPRKGTKERARYDALVERAAAARKVYTQRRAAMTPEEKAADSARRRQVKLESDAKKRGQLQAGYHPELQAKAPETPSLIAGESKVERIRRLQREYNAKYRAQKRAERHAVQASDPQQLVAAMDRAKARRPNGKAASRALAVGTSLEAISILAAPSGPFRAAGARGLSPGQMLVAKLLHVAELLLEGSG